MYNVKLKNNTMELYTLEYYKHKSKVQQLQIDWLDELCNYEREGWNEFNDDEDRDERREDIDNLYKLFTEEQKKFKELYNL